ncbi:hypothetical protein [Chromobacterium piscinae]
MLRKAMAAPAPSISPAESGRINARLNPANPQQKPASSAVSVIS